MGLTPLGGLVMGTRSGDLDPGIVAHLYREGGLDLDAIDTLLNKESGMKGLAGSNDLREVHARADAGDADAAEALEVFCYRIRCTVGAYAAALGRLDAVVFTAGIGENDADVRARVCAGLGVLGVEVDEARNTAGSRATRTISADGSRGGGAGGADERGAGDRRAGAGGGPGGRRVNAECGRTGGRVRANAALGRSDLPKAAFARDGRPLRAMRGRQPTQKPRMCRSTASAASAGSPATTAS